MNTETIRELYHAYLFDALNVGDEPMSFDEWYTETFLPLTSLGGN